MDEELFNKVVTEVSSFYRAITTPFLNRMSDHDRENAVLWSQKIMDLKNYDSLTKYLTYLTFMIINGRLVTPFDTDPNTSQIPPLPVHVGEAKMLDFIEKVVAQCQSVQNNQSSQHSTSGEISAALSNDEMAFISTQPTPGVGIRMYLATSAQPFAMWSKAENAPQATKYSLPAREVIDRGLAVAKEKFYSYLEEIEKLNKRNESSGGAGVNANCVKCQKPVSVGNVSTLDTSKSTLDGTISDINYDFGSLNDTSNRSEPTNGSRIPRQVQEETLDSTHASSNDRSACQNEVAGPSGANASTATIPPKVGKYGGYRTRPCEPLNEEDRRREAEIDEKYERWFGEPQYNKYREEIRGFLRGGTKIDAIRRAVHSHIRQQHVPGRELPLYAYDSEDESVHREIRIIHLRTRYLDVLGREYGIVDEAELYYLVGLMGLSEKNMEKARELIKYAEEGLIDENFRQKFHSVEGRTMCRLIPIIEEILQSTRRSANTSQSSIPVASQSASSSTQANKTSGRPNTSQHRSMRSMPPTSVMDNHSDSVRDDSSDHSNRSNIENEPEPEFFQRVEQLDDTQNSNEQQNPTNSTQNSSNEDQSEQEPDGRVYPHCPKENCD
ncbi:uncharacterized protein LOC135832893 [Planococcus citri]|uniref:uncharacterized protein LOC135832893 n=1 Tax=Planococcus citri TaxID=170843 RepID=UPI0031F94629